MPGAAKDDDFIVEYVHGKHSVRDYFDRTAGGWLREACRGVPEMERRCREHLLGALTDLDRLPRSHPFWRGSNMRATLTKLGDFYGRPGAPGDALPDAAWKSLAVSLQRGHRRLYMRACRMLWSAGELEVDWLLATSANLMGVSGYDTVNMTARLVRSFGLREGARARLLAMAQVPPRWHARWAERILRRLG